MEKLSELIYGLSPQEIESVKALLTSFSRFSVAGIFLLGSFLLFIISAKARSKPLIDRENFGIFFIGVAVLLWAISAFAKVISPPIDKDTIIKILISTFNNGFFLASIVFFKHGFGELRQTYLFKNRLYWVITSLITSFFITMLLIFVEKFTEDKSAAEYIEAWVSIGVTAIFGYAVLLSFKERKYNYLTLIVFFIIILCYCYMQLLLLKLDDSAGIQLVAFGRIFVIITDSSLVGMFLMLAYSSVTEELENMYYDEVENSKTIEANCESMKGVVQKQHTEIEKLHKSIQEQTIVVNSYKDEVAKYKNLESSYNEANNFIVTQRSEIEKLQKNIEQLNITINSLKETSDNQDSVIKMSRLLINYDKSNINKYILEIEFVYGKQTFEIKCVEDKVMVPYSNWIIFAIARKNGIMLNCNGMSQVKNQMSKYLNLKGNTLPVEITQKNLFVNNGGSFELDIETGNICIQNIEYLQSNMTLWDTFKNYSHCFISSTPNQKKEDKEKLDKDAFNRLLVSS